MSNDHSALTVGQLRRFLSDCKRDMAVTFGSSRYRKRPLIFFRIKDRGDNRLNIELSELDKSSKAVSECEARITVGEILDHLDRLEYKDDCEISFGSSLDAVPLEFVGLEKVVAFNLVQTQEPQWKVEGD